MPNKMLIDASHPEETRVVVLRGNRVEEFDFESADKKQLRGNIYLAKVTRVEPSLQAAFVDYGGNRHGFLAFSEIHPDYYQIPVSDRQELLNEDALAHEEEDEESRNSRRSRRHRQRAEKRRDSDDEKLAGPLPTEPEEFSAEEPGEHPASPDEAGNDGTSAERSPREELAQEGSTDETKPRAENPIVAEAAAAADSETKEETAEIVDHAAKESAPEEEHQHPVPVGSEDVTLGPLVAAEHAHETHVLAADPEGFAIVEDEAEPPPATEAAEIEARRVHEKRPVPADDEDEGDEEDEQVEQIGGDAMEEVPMRPHRPRRHYKIQEVIKRRQVLLVQVVKEERGNKGAALTTYLSLAGRYSVLMPNTARGGGISRKITDASDRQRLKAIAQELEVPEGMGVILRTAGASRTKAEVKRDFEYLLRMWENVREVTLKSTAPTLVYEEGSLIKRAIRDLYNKDIDEVIVSGEPGYREAREFMRTLMPSHAKNVHLYRDPHPMFAKYGVEAQLDAMFTNQVTLKSGGYLVINQTEALVAIDVNSGRATREHDIEDTALRTNLEAADEVARQLRLRDLAGLIVVDFIDMEESRNNRAVERRMKEALKNDRARIQIGRISHFGLLEMSRQRIRTGVLEGSTTICPHCAGSGMVRSTSSVALHVLRLLEDALIKSAAHNIIVRTRSEVALYILNQKRANLRELEQRFGVSITVAADDSLTGTAYHAMERGEPATGVIELPRPEIPLLETIESEEDTEKEAEGDAAEADHPGREDSGDEDASRRRRRRRRRGRGRGGDRDGSGIPANAPQPSDDALALVAGIEPLPIEAGEVEDPEETAEPAEEGGHEGGLRRTGRRRRRRGRGGRGSSEAGAETGQPDVSFGEVGLESPPEAEDVSQVANAAADLHASVDDAFTPPPGAEPAVEHEPESELAPETGSGSEASISDTEETASHAPEQDRPKRTGWWQKAKASLGG